ncbi:MAG TPA: ABC transporter permease [Chloroflexota bacterium]|nr:ABC transporter permease [Chloroflexota bacterium]
MSIAAQRTSVRIATGDRLRFYSTQNVPLLLSLGLLVAMIVLYVILFVAKQGHAPGSFEFVTTVNNTMSVGLASVGQTLVVLTGGIDLSVGGIVDLTNSLAATMMANNPGSMLLISLLVLLVGAGAGLLNGLLVAFGRLQPIVVTLATLAIWQGVALFVLPQPGGTIPNDFSNLLTGTVPALGNLPCGIIVLLLLIALWQVLRRTLFLVALYAIGNDERAARANGTPILLAKVGAYTLGGAFSGAAGLYFAAFTTSGDATSGTPLTLTSIAAVVLGGISLFGGRGSAVGALAGAFILTLLLSNLFFAGVNPQLQDLFSGLFLILAVVASTLVGRLLQRTRRSAG